CLGDAFTVISLMPSSPPTCLFSRPETTNAMTCLSRLWVSGNNLSARIPASFCSARRLRSRACRMALNNASSLNGFVKNLTTPAFIAPTVCTTALEEITLPRIGFTWPRGRYRQKFQHRAIIISRPNDKPRTKTHGCDEPPTNSHRDRPTGVPDGRTCPIPAVCFDRKCQLGGRF